MSLTSWPRMAFFSGSNSVFIEKVSPENIVEAAAKIVKSAKLSDFQHD